MGQKQTKRAAGQKKSVHKSEVYTQGSRAKTTHQGVERNSDKANPIWSFELIDRDGEFAFDVNRKDFQHKLVLQKLIDYSCMTWAEIKQQTHDKGKSKNHFLDPEGLSPIAEERLMKKNLEEYSEQIFSFALQNKLRIVGIRDKEIFYILWYDPNHEVYPVSRK